MCSSRYLLLLFAIAPLALAQDAAVSAPLGRLSGVRTPTDSSLVGAPYLNPSLPVEKRVDDLMSRLTSLEKAALLHGSGGFANYADIPRIGLPVVVMADGPQGVRAAVPASALPAGIALAATWDTGLAERYGAQLGRDTKATGHRILLGPGLNLARTPLNGRNFEYYGEDPVLAGKITAGYVRGVQSEKVAACVKHLAMNDQESCRIGVDVEADERTIRELHMRAFEIAVRESEPWTCMPAYNKIRGDFCAQSAYLNIALMRDTYGFDGAFISDWGAWHDDALALNGGCTIRMSFQKNAKYDAGLVDLVKTGKVPEKLFDEAVRRNLRMLFRIGAFDPESAPVARLTKENIAFARRAATEAAVLLKNTGATLPFDAKKIRRVLVVGPNAAKRFTMPSGGQDMKQFGGAGATFPAEEIGVLDAFRERLGENASTFPWSLYGGGVDEAGLTAAAKSADAVVFVGGIDYDFEHEAWVGRPDKPDLKLRGPQARVVRLLAKANPRTVVVMAGGSAMEYGEIAKAAPAFALSWYPGEQGGRAVADLLFGDANFTGKLPVTLGEKLADWRVHRNGLESYPGVAVDKSGKALERQPDLLSEQRTPKGADVRLRYKEGMALGYRGFEADGIRPTYAFGHGLSYTKFEYSGAKLAGTAAEPAVVVTVKNAGGRDGAEVVQIYAAPPAGTKSLPEARRPFRGLVAFAKVPLKAGESKTLTLPVKAEYLATWDNAAAGWKIFPGLWRFEIAAASDDTRLSVDYDRR